MLEGSSSFKGFRCLILAGVVSEADDAGPCASSANALSKVAENAGVVEAGVYVVGFNAAVVTSAAPETSHRRKHTI